MSIKVENGIKANQLRVKMFRGGLDAMNDMLNGSLVSCEDNIEIVDVKPMMHNNELDNSCQDYTVLVLYRVVPEVVITEDYGDAKVATATGEKPVKNTAKKSAKKTADAKTADASNTSANTVDANAADAKE